MNRWLLGLLALLVGCKGDTDVLNYNISPSVTLSSPHDGDTFQSGEPITFRGKVGDDGPIDELELQWSSSVDGTIDSSAAPDSEGNIEIATSNLTQGEHLVTLRAFDPEGLEGHASVDVIIEQVPELPWLQVVHPATGEHGAEGSLFTFEAKVGDAQDAPESLIVQMMSEVDTNGDGTADLGCYMVPSSAGSATCTPTTPIPVGSHLLAFTVTDTDGNTYTANASFDVLAKEDLDQDGDGWTIRQGDCDDLNKLVYPTAPELCDGLDNDCNVNTPVDGPQTECWDDDGDGYCETGACANASGTIPDCNDADPGAHPSSSPELPNGKDDNCNGTIDEGTVNYDDDGDGYCESGSCVNSKNTQRDCDDVNALAFPSNKETCDAGNVDNDCDGEWNEKDSPGCVKYYQDADGDTYGAKSGTSECWCAPGKAPFTGTNNTDCYDTNANVHPGQGAFFTYDRGDGKYDYNCDGTQEKQYRGTTTGCYENLSAIICDVQSSGWQGSEPACGASGKYLDSCGTNVDAFCIFGCGSSISCLGNCLSCTPEPSNISQACR